MLQELTIRNFAIIEDLNIRFGPGLTILSGETGAGKSIIINAFNLLLGSRASAALVRTGAQSAELEALFDISSGSRVAGIMHEMGYDPGEGLLVRRVVASNDRHRIYINGRLATIQVLTAITAHLASISGQHAHQGLLKEEEHLQILDQFGGLMGLRDQYSAAYTGMLPLIRREQELLQRRAHQGEQIALWRFQQQEIEAAALKPDEDQDLEKERLRLKNGQALYQTVQQCIDALYGGDSAVFETVGQLSKDLARMSQVDDRLTGKASELEDLTYRIEDLSAGLTDYLKHIDLDPQGLEAVEERLDTLNKLKRKYGGTLERVLAYAADLSRRLGELESLDDALAQVRSALESGQARLCSMAADLSARRRAAALRLAASVEQELALLRMEGTRFVVALDGVPAAKEGSPYLCCQQGGLTENGLDRAAFMIAPNVGEAIKPLAAIASGGELSRVVLALKAILAQNDSLETVVFDEVDAGIGGGVADGVGKKLASLARRHQILCITHLPQIARFGDQHLLIAKAVVEGRTKTTITPLDTDDRVKELARMLGGEQITPTTLAHARELLNI